MNRGRHALAARSRRRTGMTRRSTRLGMAVSLLILLAAMLATAGRATEPGTETAATEAAATEAAATEAGGELLVLQLRLDKVKLGSDFTAFKEGDRLLLPLGQLAQLLEVGIAADPGRGLAAGILPDGSRRFVLDAGSGRLTLGEEVQDLEPGSVRIEPDDLYVDGRLVAAWLPVEVELRFQDLVLDLRPRGELPIQARIAREKRQADLAARSRAMEGPVLPRHEEPYRLWSVPFVDVHAALGLDRPAEDGPTDHGDWSALVSNDLLGMSSQLFLAGSRDEPLASARWRLGRRDPFGRLLGPLRATEVAFGDIVTAPLALVARGTAERGLAVSTFPLQQAAEFDRTTIAGELPLGWQVELYRDEALLDFRNGKPDGRFSFEGVPLLYGLNDFRLVFYGPQGQKREETRRVFTGPGLIGKGRHYWRASASQADERLMTFEDDDGSEDEARGRPRLTAEYATGLSETVALRAGVASLPLDEGGRHDYVTGSASAALGPVYATLGAAADRTGGTALQTAAQTRLLGTSLSAEHVRFLDFKSEQEDELDSRTRLRLDGSLPLLRRVRLGYGLRFEHERETDGGRNSDLGLRLSTRLGRISVSNTLDLSLDQAGSGDEREIDGSLLLSGRAGRVYLRGGVDYGLTPERAIDTTVLGLDWSLGETLSANADLSHDWQGDDGSTLALGLSKRFEGFSLGLAAQAGTTGDAAVGLTLAFSLGREPRRGRWITSSAGLAGQAAASARVFLDQDGDGRFGGTDRPLAGVELQTEGSGQRAATDENGIAFLTGIPADMPARITLAAATLEDPYMLPLQEGVEAVLHPAGTGLIEFPVVMAGEVEGWVRLADETPARGREVQLRDEAGRVVARTRTDMEGYYYLDRVRPGRWQVAVADVPASARDLVIGPDGTVSTIDLSLPVAPEPAAGPSAARQPMARLPVARRPMAQSS